MSTASPAGDSEVILTSLMREEIEKKIAAGLIARVRERMFYAHRKRGFATGCDCSYCSLKRIATFEIGTLRYLPPSHHRGGFWGERQIRARHYRRALKLLEE